jgi:hypothetical protein
MDASGTSCLGSGPIPLSDELLQMSISETISKNYVSLAMLVITIAIAGCIVAYVLTAVFKLFENWRRLTRGSAGSAPELASKENIDDARSVLERAKDDLPIISEVAVARKKLQGLESRYKSYNEAMKRYASRRKEIPDDLIDNRIVSRDYDDYDYRPSRRTHQDQRVITDSSRPLMERAEQE